MMEDCIENRIPAARELIAEEHYDVHEAWRLSEDEVAAKVNLSRMEVLSEILRLIDTL